MKHSTQVSKSIKNGPPPAVCRVPLSVSSTEFCGVFSQVNTPRDQCEFGFLIAGYTYDFLETMIIFSSLPFKNSGKTRPHPFIFYYGSPVFFIEKGSEEPQENILAKDIVWKGNGLYGSEKLRSPEQDLRRWRQKLRKNYPCIQPGQKIQPKYLTPHTEVSNER